MRRLVASLFAVSAEGEGGPTLKRFSGALLFTGAIAGVVTSALPASASDAGKESSGSYESCLARYGSQDGERKGAGAQSVPAKTSDGTSPPLVGARSQSGEVYCSIWQAINNMRSLRAGYQYDIAKYGREQKWFDSTLIALGIGSVAAALYKSSVGAIGGVDLGAAGLSQYRSYYKPQAIGAAYIKAESAARCVASTSEALLNAEPESLWNQIAALRQAIVNVTAAQSQLPVSTPAAKASPDKATAAVAQASGDGSDAAAAAVTQARTTLAALDDQAEAYNDAASKIDLAHDAIKDFIDQSKQLTLVDFATVQSALQNSIQTQVTSSTSKQTATAQTTTVAQTNAQAQTSSGNDGKSAPAPAAALAPPTSLTEADKVPISTTPPAPSAAAAVTQNAAEVSALISATNDALETLNRKEFTSTNTAILTCVQGL